MAAVLKQVIAALYIMASSGFGALMLSTMLGGVDSRTTPINYKPIGNFIPPCSEKNQENCVTNSPPANKNERPCNPGDHCRGGQSQAGETEIKAQVSAATKQFEVDGHTLLDLVFAMAVGGALIFFGDLSVFGIGVMFKQVIAAPYIMASLCFGALMLPTVLCGSDSQTTRINYKPISNYIPPCSEENQENCVTHSPQANEHQRPCNSLGSPPR